MNNIAEIGDNIQQVSQIKYILSESYGFKSEDIQMVIDQCKGSLYKVIELIDSHLILNQLQTNILDKQQSLLELLAVKQSD